MEGAEVEADDDDEGQAFVFFGSLGDRIFRDLTGEFGEHEFEVERVFLDVEQVHNIPIRRCALRQALPNLKKIGR